MVFDVATIANGGTVSGEIDLQGRGVVMLILPAAFTGTAITFQSSTTSGGTFQAVYSVANAAMSVTVTQGRNYGIDPADLLGARFLKLVSNAAEGAARTITIVTRELS